MTAHKGVVVDHILVDEQPHAVAFVIHQPSTLTEPGVISRNSSMNSRLAKERRALPICLESFAVLKLLVPGIMSR